MNNYGKCKGIGSNRIMRETSNTVFKSIAEGVYRATKSRHGDLVIGGIYNDRFVRVYASRKPNVYIEGVDE